MSTLPADTSVFFLNASNEIIKKVQHVDPPTTIVYVHMNGLGIPTSITTSATDAGGYQLADIASTFELYADGSLASYRYNNMDTGDYVRVEYASVPPNQRTVFGEDSQYSHGPVTFSEILKDNIIETKSFTNGEPTHVNIEKLNVPNGGTPFKFEGNVVNGIATITMINADNPVTPIQVSGPGTLANMFNIDAAELVGQDGGTFVSDNGLGLVGQDGGSLVGQDGGTFSSLNASYLISDNGAVLVGQDGGTLLSVPTNLVGNDGASVIARDGASFTLDAAAMMRGYRAYSGPSNFTEPGDDFGESIAHAGTIAVGQTIAGSIEVSGDEDWFAVTLEAGREYTFSMTGIDGGHNLLPDPALLLRDASGNPIIQDNDGGLGRDARLTYTPTTGGTYYIAAAATPLDGLGTTSRGPYELSVEVAPTAAYVQSTAAMEISGGGAVTHAPVVAHLTSGDYAGGFVIAWVQWHENQHPAPFTSDYHLQVQIVRADGTIVDLDPRQAYTTFSPDHQGGWNDADDAHPSIAVFEDGSFVVTYTDSSYSDASPRTRTTVLRFDSEGNPDDPYPLVASGADRYSSSNAEVVVLENGNWLTFAHRWGIDYTPQNVSNVQVSLNGATLPSGSYVDITDLGSYGAISGSAFGTGAVAVWTAGTGDGGTAGVPQGDQPSAWGIHGAVLSASGTVLADFHVNEQVEYAQYITNGSQVIDLGEGRFAVAWETQLGNRASHAVLRVMSYDNGAVDDVTGDIGINGSNASIVALRDGGFAAVYGRDNQIFMQVYSESGAKIGNETVVAGGYNASAVAAHDDLIAVTYTVGDNAVRLKYMEPNLGPTNITLSNTHINENSAATTVIGTLGTVDPNGITDSFTYSIVGSDGMFYVSGNQLRFDSQSDSVVKSLDHEQTPSHTVTIRTTDSAGITFDKSFTINVDDVNEWPTGLTNTSSQVTENAALNTVIATLQATDLDGHGPFTYSLVDGAGNALTGVPFGIVGNQIRVTGTINAEAQSYYGFFVRISDGQFTTDSDVNSLHRDINYTISVNGVDDAAPTNITLSIYGDDLDVAEDTAVGTDLATLSASDPDTYDPSSLNYQIVNSDGTFRLQVDQSGATHLLLNRALNYEAATSHTLTLRVSDPGGRAYNETFTIGVNNVNEAPVITNGGTTKVITVPVGTSNTTNLYSILATDPENDALTYGTNSAGYFDFWVDSSGRLFFNNTASFAQTYNFQVYARDQGNHTTYQNVQVVVNAAPAANAAPNIIGNLNIAKQVNENTTLVAYIEATDADLDTLTWSIAGGPDASKFKIVQISNSYIGLEFKVAPNFENPTDVGSNNTYNVIVMAMDPDGAYDTQSIAVQVQNVAEQPNRAPIITSSGGGATASIKIKENVASVVSVTASDADGNAIAYSIVGGKDAGDFIINSSTGELSFLSPPDFEKPADANKDNKYSVKVQASDGSLVDTQTLTISVANNDGKAKVGGTKGDNLKGTAKEETLDGKAGDDTIKALAGGDTLIGGTGADKLYGGVDGVADTFKFFKGETGITDTTWDSVFDFVSGIDKIDLSGIDGDPASGQQDLRFVTKFKAPGKKTDGQFRVVDAGDHVNVEIDLDGDKKADMVIQVMNVDKLLITDFIL